MLDTVVLTLDLKDVLITQPDRFTPSAAGLLQPPYYRVNGKGGFRCILNPDKADRVSGRYMPRLTLSKRVCHGGYVTRLRVEFSAPKLIYGNNFEELQTENLCDVLVALERSLASLGVLVDPLRLRSAEVSAIHYSKNMLLTDYVSCSMVMRELERADISERLDTSRTDYRGGGHAIRYHCNSHELIFYDKMEDLRKAQISEKRAIEIDACASANVLDTIPHQQRRLEVLRMELRLGTREKIKQLMARIGIETKLTFEKLFDLEIAKRCLSYFWDSVRCEMYIVAPAGRLTAEQIMTHLISSAAKVGPSTLLLQMGWLSLVASLGRRGARALLSRNYNPETVGRLCRKVKKLQLPECEEFMGLKQVEKMLTEFKPLNQKALQAPASQSSVTRWGSENVELGRAA